MNDMKAVRHRYKQRYDFAASEVVGAFDELRSLEDMSPNLSFQCSLTKASTSRTLDTSLAHPAYQWPLPMAHLHVYPGWTQDDSYRIRRSGRTERGVRAYSPAWSELPTRN